MLLLLLLLLSTKMIKVA